MTSSTTTHLWKKYFLLELESAIKSQQMIMLQVRKKVQEMQHATDGSDSSKADTTATHNSSTGEGSQEINHKGVENNKKDFVADKKNDNDEKSGVSSDSTQVISDSTQYSNGDSESRIKTSQANVTLSEITDGATQLNDKDTKGNTNVNIKSDQHGTTTSTNEVKADSTEGDDKANGDNTLNDYSDNSNENNDLKDEGIDNIFGVDDEHDNDDASEVVVDTNSYVLAAKKESDRFIRVNQELIEDMWVLYDKNKDGYLSKNECKTLFNEFLLRLKDFLPVLVSTAFQEKIERGKTKMKVIGAQKREADDFELEMTMLIEQVVGHSVRLIDAVMKEANTHAVQLWALIDEDGDGIVSKDDFMDNYPRSQQKILNLIPLIASMAL